MHEGACDILYDDGDDEEGVAPRFVKVKLKEEERAAIKAALDERAAVKQATAETIASSHTPSETSEDTEPLADLFQWPPPGFVSGIPGVDVCGTFGCCLPDKHRGLHQIPHLRKSRSRTVSSMLPAQSAARVNGCHPIAPDRKPSSEAMHPFAIVPAATQDISTSGGTSKRAADAGTSGVTSKRAADAGTSGGTSKRAADAGTSGAMGKRAADAGKSSATSKWAADAGKSSATSKRAADAGTSGAMGNRAADAGTSGAMGKRAADAGKSSATSKWAADAGTSGARSKRAEDAGKSSATSKRAADAAELPLSKRPRSGECADVVLCGTYGCCLPDKHRGLHQVPALQGRLRGSSVAVSQPMSPAESSNRAALQVLNRSISYVVDSSHFFHSMFRSKAA